MAMGSLVVPQDRLSIALGNPSKVDPRPTPSAMARKIHKVRYRSRNDRRSRLGCAVILIPRSTGDTPAGGIDHLFAVFLAKALRWSAGRRSRTSSDGRQSFTPSGETTSGRLMRIGCSIIASINCASVKIGRAHV